MALTLEVDAAFHPSAALGNEEVYFGRDPAKTYGELVDGESDVRKYLGRIKDAGLVREYGTWLANRNPSLGVQIFADDNSRVKFSTAEAVDLLKSKAPSAVKHYLEYLVFAKNQPQYSEDLINFYLDSLLATISSSSSAAASTLESSYEIYAALPPPKSTYMSFITRHLRVLTSVPYLR